MAEIMKLPWRVIGGSIISDALPRTGHHYVADLSSPNGHQERDANAAFIVKAVNNHDALVKALRNIADQRTTVDNFEEYGDEFVGDYEEGYDAIIRIAREALNALVGTLPKT